MVIIDTVINTILGRLTLDPAGTHCPSWDDAFVSSLSCPSPAVKFVYAYKISCNSDDLRLRYGDITIFKSALDLNVGFSILDIFIT